MTATANDVRLSTQQMAEFVASGMLRFDAVLPEALCLRGQSELASGRWRGDVYLESGTLLNDLWPDSAFGDALRHPVISGAIQSLVGPNPRFDHRAAHLVPAAGSHGANLHQDAEVDRRQHSFDIQLSMFIQDVPPEMGGTMFIPGSHFRRVRIHNTSRYHHIVGQAPTACRMGTVVIWHHNLWHAARSNHTDQDRYMFKVRLNPRVRQQRLWNTDDIDDPAVAAILLRTEPWMGSEYRAEIINRLRLWRALTGNPTFDANSWLTRLEHGVDLSV